MSKLLERLSKVVKDLEQNGSPYELSEAGSEMRRFLQRDPVATQSQLDQGRTLVDALERRDWSLVRKLSHSPFSDVARSAEAAIRANFGRE